MAIQSSPDNLPSPIAPPTSKDPDSLPARDRFLLPLLVLTTVVVLAGASEWFSRQVFSASKTTTLPCLVLDDPHSGVHAIPNTLCSQKCYESALTSFRFNDCGHRTNLPCTPAPPGTFRIVLLGSSLAEGMWVPVEQTFAARLPEQISQLTGRKVDLYNEAMQWGTPRSVDLRLGEVFPAKPSMVLWAVTPFDIENVRLRLPYIPGKQEEDDGEKAATVVQQAAPAGLAARVQTAYRKYGSPVGFFEAMWNRAIDPLRDTRTAFVLQHLMFTNQQQFMKQTLAQGKSADFLKQETPEAWQQHLGYFDQYLADVASQLQARKIPLVIVLLPNRPQAVMLSKAEWPAGYDPTRLGAEIQAIARKHGVTYINILPDFHHVRDPDQYFYPVDGHMNAAGHALLAGMLAKELSPEVSSKLTSAGGTESMAANPHDGSDIAQRPSVGAGAGAGPSR